MAIDPYNEAQKEQDNQVLIDNNLPVNVAELQPISATDQAHGSLDTAGSTTQTETTTPIREDRFAGPDTPLMGRVKGTSSRIDLSIPENEAKMWEEHDSWRKLGWKDPKRSKLREDWYYKYFGMSHEEVMNTRRQETSEYNNPIARLDRTFQTLSIPGLAWADFGMDTLGNLPGMAVVDDWWDKKTKLDEPMHENIRKALSIILPSIQTGKLTASTVQKLPLAGWKKWAVGAGIFNASEVALISLSDEGEEHNMARAVSDLIPGLFGPKGWIPISDSIKTLDTDSPRIRKEKNRWDTSIFSGLGSILGIGLKVYKGSKVLSWMEPLDQASTVYKQAEVEKVADIDKLLKIQDIDTQLSLGSKNISRNMEANLIAERERLVQSLDDVDDLDTALDALDDAKIAEENIAANTTKRLDGGSTEFDPNLTPILEPGSNPRLTPEPGSIAKNMADTTAIKQGVTEGDPAPVITEAMRAKGLMVGTTSRDAVLGVAEQARDLGRFNALVDGFRFTSNQMNETAWAIYKDIVNPNVSLEEIKTLFATNKDTKSMLLGRFNVEYINEEQARAAAFAMRDLTDRYLGREIAQSSARVMDTLGREAASIAEAVQDLQPFVDDPAAMDLIIDKLQFLMDEYALNKYISGWQLRNKNWFDQIPPDKNINEVIDTLSSEFRSAENAIHAKNLKFTKTLKELAKTNPLMMRPLVDAFAQTNGDVDSIAKLMKWANEQITPTGMLKSPDPKKLNLFARSAWGVVYNNVLSGLSPLRTVIGNASQLIYKPINGILGHGIWGFTEDFEGLKRSFYYNGAVFETNKRAVRKAFDMMKKANSDPEFMIKSYRKDFVFQDDQTWDIMDDMRAVWEQEGNYGKVLQYDMAKTMRDMAKLPQLRYGMTGMVFSDVFSQVHLAHYLSRMRAYDDVFSEFGFADWKKINKAEKMHYDAMFDKDGMMTDQALKAISGEVSLNLDDGLANWINQGTTAYPISKFLFMFPRTGSNYVKNALSWTPISLIPGINKYSKTIWARTDEEIAAALAEHGINAATVPNATVLFKNLRAEYTGRIAFSSILTKVLWDYAMGGNIRGNGHYNASRRTKERDQLGYDAKTINIAGKWVSYKGIIGVDPILSILGDTAYYARDLDQAFMEDIQAKMMWTIAATFLNETPLQGLEPLVAAANGDMSGWARLVANTTRAFIPLSGAAGVVSNAITSTQKDIQADVIKYVQNKIPIASSFLPEQIDFWTGTPLNDIDNPFLRVLNAINPLKVSGTEEPWRKWLLTTGWDGLGRLKRDSTGSYTYTPEEREEIYRYMGELQLWKKLEKLRKSNRYSVEVGKLRAHRVTGQDLQNDRIKLEADKLPLFAEIDKIVREGQVIAEQRFLSNPANKAAAYSIQMQRAATNAMKRGDVDKASQIQKKELETRQLLQMPNK